LKLAYSMSDLTCFKLLQAVLLAAFLVVATSSERSLAETIHLEALKVPALTSGDAGPSSTELEAIVLRPADEHPHPLVVLNHGSPRQPRDRPSMTPYGMWAQALAFARRGWTAVVFMRRGYGGSQGEWAEDYGSCAKPNYAKAGQAGAKDIAAVAEFMATQPYVSKGKWISVGVSAGAFATVALSAEAPPGLAAAISFAPGRGSTGPDFVCGESELIAAFAQYGKTSRIPLLWVSAGNDHFFGPRLVAQMTDAFSAAGGNLTYVKIASFGTEGHQLFSANGIPVWTPIVDRFLSANKLVFRDKLIDVPRPEVTVPASLNSRGKEAFGTYLESGPNKAFAVGRGSHFGWATGRGTIEAARKDALRLCAANTSAACAVVNVNDKPVQ
jgi:dienelactone hydrolase